MGFLLKLKLDKILSNKRYPLIFTLIVSILSCSNSHNSCIDKSNTEDNQILILQNITPETFVKDYDEEIILLGKDQGISVLSRINKNGEIIWSKKFTNGFDIKTITPISGTDFVVAGSVNRELDPGSSMAVMKLSVGGYPIWFKNIICTYYHKVFIKDIYEMPNNKLLATGEGLDINSNNRRVLINVILHINDGSLYRIYSF